MRESQTFEVAVNVAAGSSVSFKLDYQELLKRRLGVYNHVIYADPSQVCHTKKILTILLFCGKTDFMVESVNKLQNISI